MAERPALVQNAADSKQVRYARRAEKSDRERELDDIRSILATEEGRRFFWRLMGWSGMYENPTHPRGDQTHQNIGKADCGRFLLAEIMEANEDAYLVMQQEAWLRARRSSTGAEASRIASAETKTE